MNCCLQNILHINLHILYILYSRQIQKFKNDENPTSTSQDTCKTIFIILYKLFSYMN